MAPNQHFIKGATKLYFAHFSCVIIICSMRVYISLAKNVDRYGTKSALY